jgi:acid phosphatase type 7
MKKRLRRAAGGPRRAAVAVTVAAFTLAGAGTGLAETGTFSGDDNPWPYADPGPAPVLAAVGDIACEPGSPGDEQYQAGRYQDFMGSFDHTYGAFKFLQRPSPGNHEFYTSHGETGVNGYAYFDYYNGYQLDNTGNPATHNFTDSSGASFTQPQPRPLGQAGEFGAAGNGWYSYDLAGCTSSR